MIRQWLFVKTIVELTAAGTAPEFPKNQEHRIPILRLLHVEAFHQGEANIGKYKVVSFCFLEWEGKSRLTNRIALKLFVDFVLFCGL